MLSAEGLGLRVQHSDSRMRDSEFRVPGSEFRVPGSGFRSSTPVSLFFWLWFRLQTSGFGAQLTCKRGQETSRPAQPCCLMSACTGSKLSPSQAPTCVRGGL